MQVLDAEQTIRVKALDLAAALGPDWRFIKQDTLVELGTQMVLSYGADIASEINLGSALAAAVGWGGERAQFLHNSKRDERVLVFHWHWDTAADAGEFRLALSVHLHQRYRGDTLDANGDCWELLNEHVSYMFFNGQDTLWLRAPNLGTLYLLRAQFVAFN